MHTQRWPAFDPTLATAREVTVVVQIDGKVRDRLVLPAGLPDAELRSRALASEKAKAALGGAAPAKVVVVPDRLVSIVTK